MCSQVANRAPYAATPFVLKGLASMSDKTQINEEVLRMQGEIDTVRIQKRGGKWI